MSWCHGDLSRTISMVLVHPFYCHITNAQRLPLQFISGITHLMVHALDGSTKTISERRGG